MGELTPWLRLILRRKHRLTAGGLLMLATLLSGIGLLALSGWFITATALAGALLAAGYAMTLDVYVPGAGIRFFALTRTVSRYFERLYNHDTVLRLLADIRVMVFAAMARQPYRQQAKRKSADWLSRLTGDINALDNLYLQWLAPSAVVLLAFSLITLVLASVQWQLLYALLPLALIPPLLFVLFKICRKATADSQEGLSVLRSAALDTLSGQAELMAARHWQAHTDTLVTHSHELQELRSRVDRNISLGQSITTLLVQLSAFLVLVGGLSIWQSGGLSGPLVALFTLAVMALGEGLAMLPQAYGQLGATLVAAKRLNEDRPLATAATAITCNDSSLFRDQTLMAEGLSLRIEATPLLRPLSFRLAPGERLAVLGPSGSGKSTLADLVAGLLPDYEGTLNTLPGHALPSQPRWAASISYLPQQSWLFADTVRANLLLARSEADDEALWQVLHAVALDKVIRRLPQGLDSFIGEQGQYLSGGEGRRLALARALLRPASLLILDEPFTGVDESTRALVTERMAPYLESKTCLFLGHARSHLPNTDHQLSLG
ncbi:MAG: thiol reductant ABC exporter subunit CydC [Marinobacter sp.]|nr:thiol reductant ABC exporter subunit CydC [Marinobacter sp.]